MLETFLAGFSRWKDVIATGVAIIAIVAVVYQIGQASRFERQRLRREQVAARATLPLTLAALSDFGQDMIAALAPLETWLAAKEESAAPRFVGPRLSQETVAAAEKVIGAYPNEDIARALAALLGEVQVLRSRTRDFASNPDSVRSWTVAMRGNVVMAASVVARCENLFSFAREDSQYPEPEQQQLEQILTVNGIAQHRFPRVWDYTKSIGDEQRLSATLAGKRVKRKA